MGLRGMKRVKLEGSADSEPEVCRLWLARAFLISDVKTLSRGKIKFPWFRCVPP